MSYDPHQIGGADAPSYGIASTLAEEQKSMHQIASELFQSDDQLAGLHQAITELEARLSDVTRPEEDVRMGAEPNTPRQPLVPLAEKLRSNNGQTGLARMRIVSLLERLEL